MYLKAIQAFKLQQTSTLKINSDLMCFITSFTDRVANLSLTLPRHSNEGTYCFRVAAGEWNELMMAFYNLNRTTLLKAEEKWHPS